jgi:Tfp pilus assembly protein PilF
MTTSEVEISSAKRKLLLHDGVAFLILTLIAVALFGVTLFLFRSFEEHRAELGRRWAERGRQTLKAGRPEMAIVPLRTAMSYVPDDRASALLLAQALGDAGHTEEATNYFLNLWEVRPGDGFINLQLARLERRKKDAQAAVNYYRAAVYGTWEGDGVERRRDVRLELARYLLEQHDLRAAQVELQIASGNAPDDAGLDEVFADRFDEAGDTRDALTYYKKAIKDGPHNRGALVKAGGLAYRVGEYGEARALLARAIRESSGTRHGVGEQRGNVDEMFERADRMVELAPFRSLSARERGRRVLDAREIARKRMEACLAGPGTTGSVVAPEMMDLQARWGMAEVRSGREALARDEVKQDALLKLIYETELATSKICGAPTGDDALLLRLAQVAPAQESSESAGQGGR